MADKQITEMRTLLGLKQRRQFNRKLVHGTESSYFTASDPRSLESLFRRTEKMLCLCFVQKQVKQGETASFKCSNPEMERVGQGCDVPKTPLNNIY